MVIRFLPDIYFANIFYHAVAFLFIFLIVIFKPQTCLILIKPNLSIFSLVPVLLVTSFRVVSTGRKASSSGTREKLFPSLQF